MINFKYILALILLLTISASSWAKSNINTIVIENGVDEENYLILTSEVTNDQDDKVIYKIHTCSTIFLLSQNSPSKVPWHSLKKELKREKSIKKYCNQKKTITKSLSYGEVIERADDLQATFAYRDTELLTEHVYFGVPVYLYVQFLFTTLSSKTFEELKGFRAANKGLKKTPQTIARRKILFNNYRVARFINTKFFQLALLTGIYMAGDEFIGNFYAKKEAEEIMDLPGGVKIVKHHTDTSIDELKNDLSDIFN